jgi:hypothetical protein
MSLAILYFVTPTDFFAVDSCLDQGGCWNYNARQCVLEQDLEMLCEQE